MTYIIQRLLPRFLHRYILHFEAVIEDSIKVFSAKLPASAQVLDAGAGEGTHARFFRPENYVGIDLGIGDAQWDYSRLNVVGDLITLPFRTGSFDACLNVVTLEHVKEPGLVLAEIARVLKPGGRFLLVVPHEWEVHQAPHDYFRFTGHGAAYLLEKAGFASIEVRPVGGYFRLLARRLLNGLQFFSGPAFFFAALLLAPLALLLPTLDRLDRNRNFTLGYICNAVRP